MEPYKLYVNSLISGVVICKAGGKHVFNITVGHLYRLLAMLVTWFTVNELRRRLDVLEFSDDLRRELSTVVKLKCDLCYKQQDYVHQLVSDFCSYLGSDGPKHANLGDMILVQHDPLAIFGRK